MNTGNQTPLTPGAPPNENEVSEEVDVTEIYTRLDSLEALSKKSGADIKALDKRVTDCEDSIDALAE
jgi:hypothetical protein